MNINSRMVFMINLSLVLHFAYWPVGIHRVIFNNLDFFIL